MFIKSIRWRLQLWVAFLLVCVLSGFGVTVYQLQRQRQLNQVDEDLEGRITALGLEVRRGPVPFEPGPGHLPPEPGPMDPGFEKGLRPPPSGGPQFGPPGGASRMLEPFPEIRLSPEVAGLFGTAQAAGFYFAVWGRDGILLKSSTNAPAGLRCPKHLLADTRTHKRTRDSLREVYHFTELGDCILAGCPLTAHLSAMRRLTGLLLAAGGGVLALGLGGGWWLADRAIRPIAQISDAAGRISAGNLSERINVAAADDELGRLAAVLNSTFARLEAAFAQQWRFTADASHELRTPLTVMISEAQTTLARERNAAEYRETVEGCLGTAQQMRRLVESLLQLARFDAGQQQIEREPFDLSLVVSQCVELLQPLAAARGIRIESALPAVQCRGDAERIYQVVLNLLSNAIDYNDVSGVVRVATTRENTVASLTVENAGPGISAEDLPHIFERFHRGDKARTAAAGHSGLGLAIVKAIVEAHGGSIAAKSQPGRTVFSVKLPL